MSRRSARLGQAGLPHLPAQPGPTSQHVPIDGSQGAPSRGKAGRGGTPSGPPAELGPRFPGYHVLDQADTWDDVAKGAVLCRLGPPLPLRFFTVDEERVARPLVDRLVAQEGEGRLAVLEMIDARLSEKQTDGWRFDNLPPDSEAWRRSLAALDTDAVTVTGDHFAELGVGRQYDVLESVRTNPGDWHGLPAARIWDLWMLYACTAVFSHPLAWNDIGFGGPAFPRRRHQGSGRGAHGPRHR